MALNVCNSTRPVRLRLLLFSLAIVAAVLFQLALDRDAWAALWAGILPHSWDGTSHYGILQIYSNQIFPDTFGWTNAFFSGMPVPNEYPPAFYWLTSALAHALPLSLSSSFKIILGLSTLLVPFSLSGIAWCRSRHNWTATLAVFLSASVLLVDKRFVYPIGSHHASTFLIGLISQPLGLVFLCLWYATYRSKQRTASAFAASAVLFAMVLLTNFFAACVAVILVVSHVLVDIVEAVPFRTRGALRALRTDLSGVFIGICLSAFWLWPLLRTWDFVVTRPEPNTLGPMYTTQLLVWYALAALGLAVCLRNGRSEGIAFALCAVVITAASASGAWAPKWLPLQSPRLVSLLNVLLSVPVGMLVAEIWTPIQVRITRNRRCAALNAAALAAAVALTFVLVRPTTYRFAFYSAENGDLRRIQGVLDFAKHHTDGTYLIEIAPFSRPGPALDSRALMGFLGGQGARVISNAFREASPNSVFLIPMSGALSTFHDNFGLSSMLAEDLSFARQTRANHLERARALGVRYLAVVSADLKQKLSREELIQTRFDCGAWTVFQLRNPIPETAQVARFAPALLVSGFSLKQTRRSDGDFVRFAQEQFASRWFDVLLVHSSEPRLDRIRDMARFGAVIVNSYSYDSEDAAYAALQQFARTRPVVLMPSEAPLYHRIQRSRSAFVHLVPLMPRSSGDRSWIQFSWPSVDYRDNPIRRYWNEIREILDRNRVPISAKDVVVRSATTPRSIVLETGSKDIVPVYVMNSYHPAWRRIDGEPLYAATPFHTLTFVRDRAELIFQRDETDRVAAWISALSVLALLFSHSRRVVSSNLH